jgi:protein tyrosine phosphatase
MPSISRFASRLFNKKPISEVSSPAGDNDQLRLSQNPSCDGSPATKNVHNRFSGLKKKASSLRKSLNIKQTKAASKKSSDRNVDANEPAATQSAATQSAPNRAGPKESAPRTGNELTFSEYLQLFSKQLNKRIDEKADCSALDDPLITAIWQAFQRNTKKETVARHFHNADIDSTYVCPAKRRDRILVKDTVLLDRFRFPGFGLRNRTEKKLKYCLDANAVGLNWSKHFIASSSPSAEDANSFNLMVLDQRAALIVDIKDDIRSKVKASNDLHPKLTVAATNPPTVTESKLAFNGFQDRGHVKVMNIKNEGKEWDVGKLTYEWPVDGHLMPHELIALSDRVIEFSNCSKNSSHGPVVVCSEDGVGRTGVLISFIAARRKINEMLADRKCAGQPTFTPADMIRTLLEVIADGRMARGPDFVEYEGQFKLILESLFTAFKDEVRFPSAQVGSKLRGHDAILGGSEPQRVAPEIAQVAGPNLGKNQTSPLDRVSPRSSTSSYDDLNYSCSSSDDNSDCSTTSPDNDLDYSSTSSNEVLLTGSEFSVQSPKSGYVPIGEEPIEMESTATGSEIVEPTEPDPSDTTQHQTIGEILKEVITEYDASEAPEVAGNGSEVVGKIPKDEPHDQASPVLEATRRQSDPETQEVIATAANLNAELAAPVLSNDASTVLPMKAQRLVAQFGEVNLLTNQIEKGKTMEINAHRIIFDRRPLAEMVKSTAPDSAASNSATPNSITPTLASPKSASTKSAATAKRANIAIAGTSPQGFELCEQFLVSGFETGKGIFQFCSPLVHYYPDEIKDNKSRKPVIEMLTDKWQERAIDNDYLIIGERYKITNIEPTIDPDNHDVKQVTVTALDLLNPDSDNVTMIITQTGIMFDNRLFGVPEIGRADYLITQHVNKQLMVSKRSQSKAGDSHDPITVSTGGYHRNAVLISYREAVSRLAEINNEDEIPAMLEEIREKGRQSRGRLFIPTLIQFNELKKAVLKEYREQNNAPKVKVGE